jgi:hypothetical protein
MTRDFRSAGLKRFLTTLTALAFASLAAAVEPEAASPASASIVDRTGAAIKHGATKTGEAVRHGAEKAGEVLITTASRTKAGFEKGAKKVSAAVATGTQKVKAVVAGASTPD